MEVKARNFGSHFNCFSSKPKEKKAGSSFRDSESIEKLCVPGIKNPQQDLEDMNMDLSSESSDSEEESSSGSEYSEEDSTFGLEPKIIFPCNEMDERKDDDEEQRTETPADGDRDYEGLVDFLCDAFKEARGTQCSEVYASLGGVLTGACKMTIKNVVASSREHLFLSKAFCGRQRVVEFSSLDEAGLRCRIGSFPTQERDELEKIVLSPSHALFVEYATKQFGETSRTLSYTIATDGKTAVVKYPKIKGADHESLLLPVLREEGVRKAMVRFLVRKHLKFMRSNGETGEACKNFSEIVYKLLNKNVVFCCNDGVSAVDTKQKENLKCQVSECKEWKEGENPVFICFEPKSETGINYVKKTDSWWVIAMRYRYAYPLQLIWEFANPSIVCMAAARCALTADIHTLYNESKFLNEYRKHMKERFSNVPQKEMQLPNTYIQEFRVLFAYFVTLRESNIIVWKNGFAEKMDAQYQLTMRTFRTSAEELLKSVAEEKHICIFSKA